MSDLVQWLSADGAQLLTLNDPAAGYRVLADGTTGLNSPPYRFATDTYAGIDGVAVQQVAADARSVTLGMMVQARDEETLRARTRALTRAMRPKVGPGTLIVSTATGTVRRLRCHYKGGAEGSEARGATLPGRWWRFVLELLAADPWWYGDPVTLSVGLGVGGPFFPFFPLALAPSQVQGQFNVDLSSSDSEAYPVWTITGPGTALTLTNNTTGRQIVVNATLAAGETMIIDTRPGMQSVRRGDGTNLMGALNSDPALWPLVEDVNSVTAQLAGATTASRISGVYEPRFAGI